MPSREDSGSGSDSDGSDESLQELIKTRRCTDRLCGLFFVVAMGFLVSMFVYGTTHGNTRKLSHGFNSKGEQCGIDEAVKDRPLLYFCPVVTSTGGDSVDTKDPVCVGVCPTAGDDVSLCSVTRAYQTEAHSRYCLPSGSAEAEARREVQESTQNFLVDSTEVLARVGRAWTVLAMVVVVAMVMGYIFLFLLKTVARCIIWVCALIGFLAFAALGFFLWSKSKTDQSGEAFQTAFQVGAIVSWCLSVVVMLLVSCCGQAVELSTACMGQAAHVIWQMPLLLLAPLFKGIFKVIAFVVLLIGFIHLLSTGDTTGVGRERHIEYTGQQKGYLFGYAFAALWLLNFISALYQFSIAYAAAQYYVARSADGTKDVSQCAVCQGVYTGIRYHTGSLAFGSAIVAALEMIQRLLEWARAKSELEANNQCVSCIISIILCCCGCIEQIVKFISKNVYIDIALTSNNFCEATTAIFEIFLHHGAAFAILNGATYIFQIVGMASITATCGLLAAYMLTNGDYVDPTSEFYIENPTVGIIISCVLALMVAWSFMAIFDMTSDTILICHAEDKARNGGKHAADNQDCADLYAKAEKKVAERNERIAAWKRSCAADAEVAEQRAAWEERNGKGADGRAWEEHDFSTDSEWLAFVRRPWRRS